MNKIIALLGLPIIALGLTAVSVEAYQIKRDNDDISAVSHTIDVPFTCAYTGLSASISLGPDTDSKTIDALIDGVCAAYDSTLEEPEYTLTCFDNDGMVTDGNDWVECLPIAINNQQ